MGHLLQELKRVDEVGAARKRAEAAQAAAARCRSRGQRRPYQGHARALAAAPVVSGAVLPDERLSAAALAEQAAADATAEAAGLSACAIAILARRAPARHHLSGHVSRREALHLPPAADASEDAEGEAFSRPPRATPPTRADEPLPGGSLPTMGGGAPRWRRRRVAAAKAAGRAAAQAQARAQRRRRGGGQWRRDLRRR